MPCCEPEVPCVPCFPEHVELVSVVCARQTLKCHGGFQELYTKKALSFLSPRDQIYHVVDNHTTSNGKLKETLEKVTVCGHSLGGGIPSVVYWSGRLDTSC